MFQLSRFVTRPVLRLGTKKYFYRNMSQLPARNPFAWIDLEMTGLDENIHHIIEVACIVTKPDLSKIGDGIHLVIHQPEQVHDNSESWSLAHHQKSGLRDESINSKISIEEADKRVSEYLESCRDQTSPAQFHMAGNSIYTDRRFIEKYMPSVNLLLHYQIIDVTSIRLLYYNWFSDKPFLKSYKHRALSDIESSIKELKFYRDIFFKTL